MMGALAVAALRACLLLSQDGKGGLHEGIYSTGEEVKQFSVECLELRDGRFRYWRSSDVKTKGQDDAPFPWTGTYAIAKDRISFVCADHRIADRIIDTINAIPVLLTEQASKRWKEATRISSYGTLLYMPGASDEVVGNVFPKIKSLYDERLSKIEAAAQSERLNAVPPKARELLELMTGLEVDGAQLRRLIDAQRERPETELVGQLVSQLGSDAPYHAESLSLLERIYLKNWRDEKEPLFKSKPDTLQQALQALNTALPGVRDRAGVTHCLRLFMSAANVARAELPVSGTGVRLDLKIGADTTFTDNSAAPINDPHLRASITPVVKACQEWMTQQARNIR
jgi:hypothetical protein